jgi:hypothetical protein
MQIYTSFSGCRNHSALHGGGDTHSSALQVSRPNNSYTLQLNKYWGSGALWVWVLFQIPSLPPCFQISRRLPVFLFNMHSLKFLSRSPASDTQHGAWATWGVKTGTWRGLW